MPSKATARTLVRVPPGGTFLFRTAENVPTLGDHQRNQVAMIKSRVVLSSALKQPEVGGLTILQKWPEPIEWLEKEVQADFAVAPEIVRIALSGDDPEELKTIVNAIRVAYCREILDKERQERVDRLTKLGQLRERHQE